MTVITKVPLFSEEIYRYSVVLAGQVRYLRFYFNERTKFWYMDIENEGHYKVMSGIKLIPNFPILQDYALENWEGHFWLLPKSNMSKGIQSDRFAMAEHFDLYHFYVQPE